MFMETTLFFKTMIILSSQLGIVLLGCLFFIKKANQAYKEDSKLLGLRFIGSVNMKNQLDLIPYNELPKSFPKTMTKEDEYQRDFAQPVNIFKNTITRTEIALNESEESSLLKLGFKHATQTNKSVYFLGFAWIISLCMTLFFVSGVSSVSITAQALMFSLNSILTGPLIGLIILEMDENDGYKALKIVFFVTILTGFIGYSDFIPFSESTIFAALLFISLIGIILFNIVRTFRNISRSTNRAAAIFGAFVFSLFLLFDFNLLAKAGEISDLNNWNTAFTIAFTIYLDIINLLLEILEAMGD
mgnify:FL=1